jgi:hypothetical protein
MKIGAILHMGCPCNAMDLCMFIGCINYYRNMWLSHTHNLKPLTDQCCLKKKAPINCTDKMQKAFNKVHLLMAADALAAYPDQDSWLIYTLMLLTFR